MSIANHSALPQGLSLRPASASDSAFISRVYCSARPDLQWLDGGTDLMQTVLEQQFQVLQQGMAKHYPNAMQFVVEKAGGRIGVVMVDFGHNEVHIIFLAMLPEVRGLGYGKGVLQGLQQAAWQVRSPLAVVVWRSNLQARQLYHALGFVLELAGEVADKLVWYPQPPSV